MGQVWVRANVLRKTTLSDSVHWVRCIFILTVLETEPRVFGLSNIPSFLNFYLFWYRGIWSLWTLCL